MKKRNRWKGLTALILALVMAAVSPLNARASSGSGKYVSDVYVAYGKNAEEAIKTLKDKGYTPVEGNLNDGGKTYVMLGYKTTGDIRDSITDLAVMNMRGDYSVEDYRTLIKKQKAEIAEFLTGFMAVIHEYRANLKAGKTRAVYVHDLLNYYIEDDSGRKMGDLLNSETLQDKAGIEASIEHKNPEKLPDLITIVMQGNAQVIRSVEVLLSMAADTAENSWIDRFAERDYEQLLDKVKTERPDLNTLMKRIQYLDNTYGEEAEALSLEANDLRARLNDYISSGQKADTMTEEDVRKNFGDIEKDMGAALRYQDFLSIAAVCEGLKNYEGGRFKKGELLDFFLKEPDPEDHESFIPMAAALSEGQRSGLPFVNLEQLIKYAFTSEAGWKAFADQNKAYFDGLKEVSVYQNIDRDLYREDGSVALTGAARRANNTIAGTIGREIEQMDTLARITAISYAVTAGCTLVTLGTWGVRRYLLSKIEDPSIVINGEQYEYFLSLANMACKPESIAALKRMRLAVNLSRVFVVVTLAVVVWSAVMTVIDFHQDRTYQQLPIPKYLVDNYTNADGGNYSLNYKAVECNREAYFGADYKVQKGSSADLLADEGKQWLVLYASKNSKAGKPLTPNFVVQKSSQAPVGYDGMVHLFGEKGAVNAASVAFRNYSTFSTLWQAAAGDKYKLYVFSKLSTDVKTYDESAGNMRASAISNGTAAILGFGGLALGAVLGVCGTILVRKKKKEEALA